MFKLFNRSTRVKDLLTIEQLESNRSSLKNLTLKDKKNVKILFLDDEGYDIEELIKLGYIDVQKSFEYTQLDDYEKYDIIFCDINGIAKEIDEEYQGAALAKIIKETYPTKIVVIFSAKQQYLTFNQYYQNVDDVIPKNIKTADLVEKINYYICKQSDPVEFWKMIRNQLYKQKTSSKVISELEHYFVKSLIDNKDYTNQINLESTPVQTEIISRIINLMTTFINLYLEIKGN